MTYYLTNKYYNIQNYLLLINWIIKTQWKIIFKNINSHKFILLLFLERNRNFIQKKNEHYRKKKVEIIIKIELSGFIWS